MLPHARRVSRLLLSAPLVAAALVPATAAQAAAPAAHLISLAQAREALPAPAVMPGHPETVVTTTAIGVNAPVCIGPTAKPLRLKNAHLVTNLYVSNGAKSTFAITAFVFHTAAAAKVGLAAVLHAEHACPARQSAPDGSVVRTLSQKYGAGSWTGWRSTDHLTIPSDPNDPTPPMTMRLSAEFLARGNVLLELTETSMAGQGSGPAQEAARKTATKAMLAGFAKL